MLCLYLVQDLLHQIKTQLFHTDSAVHLKSSCLFVCFVALRPKSKAMVMVGQLVHLTTLFPGQAEGRRMTIEIISPQWVSGRVLDWRPRGCGFQPHLCHCVVVLEQDPFLFN